MAAARFQQLQQQQHQFGQQSLHFKQLGGLSALLAEEEAAAAAAAAAAKQALAQGSLLQQRQQSQSLAGAGLAPTGMQQQEQQPTPAQQQPQQQQQQEPQYNTSSIADCPELLLRLKELPGPAVQQVGRTGRNMLFTILKLLNCLQAVHTARCVWQLQLQQTSAAAVRVSCSDRPVGVHGVSLCSYTPVM
jgi:hypothetical protein